MNDPSTTPPRPPPRMNSPQRDRVERREASLDSLVPPEHPVRTVWAFTQAMDIDALRDLIKSRQGHSGRPAIDPAVLVGLWLWATVDGVGSAREISRLCERDDTYRWLCGGVGVNHHALSDARVRHAHWLDEQLTRSVAALLAKGLVTLRTVSQDGMRVRASAKAASFRRRERLEPYLAQARARVQTLKAELDNDGGAAQRRRAAARERAARERQQRLEEALAMLEALEAKRPAPRASPVPNEPDDDGSPPPTSGAGAKESSVASKTNKRKGPAPLRVSTTDPGARVMKMADGGFRPAWNVQLAVDTATWTIVGVEVVGVGSDLSQMVPMYEQVHRRYRSTPETWLADGGFTNLEAIEALVGSGTEVLVPPPRSRKAGVDPGAPRERDTEVLAAWRAYMATEQAAERYKERAATIECANAHVRYQGLNQFAVRGREKVRCVALWHALAHQIRRLFHRGIAVPA